MRLALASGLEAEGTCATARLEHPVAGEILQGLPSLRIVMV